jgi:hypothetical protein
MAVNAIRSIRAILYKIYRSWQSMKHWHPGQFDGEQGGPGSGKGRDRDPQFPPGWWVVGAIFIGLFLWAAIFLAASWLFDWAPF